MKKLFFLFALTISFSCNKNDVSLDDLNSGIPVIELLNVSANSIQQNTDPLIFTIMYTDGDGNLGTEDADTKSIELVDNRDPQQLIFEYHLSPRAPVGSTISVQGELDIVLDNPILLNENSTSETTTFSIRIRDAAGNWSNVVESSEVEILE